MNNEIIRAIGENASEIMSLLEKYQDKNAEELQVSDDCLNIYCDGSGWNGLVSGWCIFADGMDLKPNPILMKFPVEYTNNEMEYYAMIKALIVSMAVKKPVVYSDSKLVVEQLNGNYKVKSENLLLLSNIARNLIDATEAKVVWIPRDKNKAGQLLDKYMKKLGE